MEIYDQINDIIRQDTFFWFCAIAGSALFILQFLLSLFLGNAGENGEEIDSENFKWLSKNALTGFLMMFGWVGLTCRKEFELSILSSVVFAALGGLIMIFIVHFIFSKAKKLRSFGTVFRIEDALGKEAIVYQRIPKGGIGKISISLYNFTYELDATSSHLEDLPSFSTVTIIKKLDEKTVVVLPT